MFLLTRPHIVTRDMLEVYTEILFAYWINFTAANWLGMSLR